MGRDKKRGKQKRTQPVVDPRLRTRSRIEAQSPKSTGPPPRGTKNVRVEGPNNYKTDLYQARGRQIETGDNQRNFIKAISKALADNTVGLHRSTHAGRK